MDAKKWRKAKDILSEVLELGPNEREKVLTGLDDTEVRAEVESLLAFEEESERSMLLTAVDLSRDFFDEDGSSPLIGQQVGSYMIVRELGYGGMGAVYLAKRADGKFEQTVALKLLKREMNTSALRRRFQQEREILASLEHPNIARLLDAGTTDDMIPYLAMEYVEGMPIDDYCDKNRLDLNGRLDLFRKVCSAVSFAHRNLIVHRDLKPTNILVTDDGTPKLLDFGISKILSAELEEAGSATVTKLGVMTPGYASPEQLQGKSVTTATDIYSLGVILYELLSGHRPFGTDGGDLKEVYHAVLEREPPPPSALVATISREIKAKTEAKTEVKSPDEIESAVTLRADTAAGIIRTTRAHTVGFSSNALRGDLDNIVLKALRKEPDRRYSSAENFADDIHRHQRGLPVTARPNTFSYRAGKFIKRNRAAVVGAALFALAIIGGIIATLWQARATQVERAKAERRFTEVRALANSFLFEFSPKIANLPGSMPARELLVRRALEYLDNLSKEAAGDRELERELAAAYQAVGDVQGNPYSPNIGDTKGALDSYEKSQAIRQRLSEQEPDNLEAHADLANIFKLTGELHSNGGDYEKAGQFLDRALELREMIVERSGQSFESRAKLAELLRARGLIPFYDGDNKKAIEYYSRAKDIAEKLRTEQPEDPKIAEQYAFLFVSIGEAQGWDNDFKGASTPLQTGLDMLIPLGEKYPNDISIQRSVMLAHNKRAENHQDLEEFEKSVELFSVGARIAENLLLADPQSFQAKRDVAMCNKKLAQALDDAGRSRESLEKLNLAHRMFAEMSAADPKNTEYPYDAANTRFSIGETYLTLKDHQAALETFSKAKIEFQAVLAANPENTYAMRMSAYNLNRLGKTYAILAEKGNRAEYLELAHQNLRASLDRLNEMKAAGKLGEVDFKEIAEMEKQIAALRPS